MTVLILSREKTYGERVFHPRMSKVIVGLQPGICVRQKRRRKKEVNRTDYFFFLMVCNCLGTAREEDI